MFNKEFIIGHAYYYFILYDFSLIENINQWLFNSFKPCTFIERKPNRAGVYKNYFEVNVPGFSIVELGNFESEQLIYNDEEHILRTLLTYYNNVKFKQNANIKNTRLLEMDEFIKNKIKISQEKSPEKWI